MKQALRKKSFSAICGHRYIHDRGLHYYSLRIKEMYIMFYLTLTLLLPLTP